MKIKLISVLVTLCYLPFATAQKLDDQPEKDPKATSSRAEKLPKTWSSDSRAVYDLMLAQFRHAGTDYAGSADTLVKFAKAQKDDHLYSKAYDALLQAQRYADAVALAEVWEKHSKLAVNQFYVLALVLNGDIDKAINEIDKAVEKRKDAPKEVLTPYLQLLLSHWYSPQVSQTVERLYDAYPDSDLVGNIYSQLLRWQGDIESAVKIIEKKRFDDPRNLELVQRQSDIYRYAVRLDEAEKVWRDLLADFPNEAKYRFAYAQFLYDRYDFSGAAAQLDKVHTSDFQEVVNVLKMLTLVQLRQFDKATTLFEQHFANKESDEARARFLLGQRLLEQEQWQLAKKYLLPLVDFDKNENSGYGPPAAFLIGQILYQTAKDKDFSEGDAWIEKISQHYQFSAEERLQGQANALQDAGYLQTAYERVNTFLKENPNHESMRYTRCLLAADLGLDTVAIEDFRMLHAQSPDDINVQNALGYTLLENPNTREEGEKLVKKALLNKPSDPAIVDSMGWAAFKRQSFDEALQFFRVSYAKYRDGEIIGHYILGLHASGQVALAKKLYQLEIRNKHNVKKIEKHVKAILPELKK